MGKQQPVWFGMKVTPEQKRKIRHLADREGTSAKEAVIRLVEEALAKEQLHSATGSFVSGIENIIGSIDGPTDLASNPKLLDGFGR